MDASFKPIALDHVALWAPDRRALAEFLTDTIGLRIIEQTDRFTLVGVDAGLGKITLFDRPGTSEPAISKLVSILLHANPGEEQAPVVAPGGFAFTFGSHPKVASGTPRGTMIGVSLRSTDPTASAARYCATFGFEPVAVHPDVASIAAGNEVITLVRESPIPVEQPMLNHLGLLVRSADDHIRAAGELGVEVTKVVDTDNTKAIFVDGPEQVTLEFIEHKPEFALV